MTAFPTNSFETAAPTSLWVLGDRLSLLGSCEPLGLHVLDAFVPPGSGVPLHRHASPEVFRVTEGEIVFTLFVDGELREVEACKGRAVVVPGGVPHAYRNGGAWPASMAVAVEQQMVDFFLAVGSERKPLAPPSADDLARLTEIAGRFGIEMLEGEPACEQGALAVRVRGCPRNLPVKVR